MGKKKCEGWVLIRLNLRFYPGGHGVGLLKKVFLRQEKKSLFSKIVKGFWMGGRSGYGVSSSGIARSRRDLQEYM